MAAKRRIAQRYTEILEDVPGLTPMREARWAFSTFWMYSVLVEEEQYGIDSRALLRRLDRMSIQSRPLWQPLHQSPAHAGAQTMGGDGGDGDLSKGFEPALFGGAGRSANIYFAGASGMYTRLNQ